MAMANGGRVDLLHTMTFVDALGESGRQSIAGNASWAKYDMLLFVPDITITAQDGQTSGNWLRMEIARGSTLNGNYNSLGTVGKRDEYFTACVCKGWNGDRYYWRYGFIGDRGGSIPFANTQDKDSETLADLTYKYGPYYGGTNATMSGTVKIYGVKYPT